MRPWKSSSMSIRSVVLLSICGGVIFCGSLILLHRMELTSGFASVIGTPGAWVGIQLFGEGHDWPTVVGIVLGELLFSSSIVFVVLLSARQIAKRRAGSSEKS